MRHDDVSIALARQRTDLRDLIGSTCPWCDGEMTVGPDRFLCWSCQSSGDTYTYVMRAAGCTFDEAVDLLLARPVT